MIDWQRDLTHFEETIKYGIGKNNKIGNFVKNHTDKKIKKCRKVPIFLRKS